MVDDGVAGGVEAVARGYLAAFATRDPDGIAAWVGDDFVNEHVAALGEGCVGRVAYRERLPGFLADMVDLAYEVDDLVVEGPTCVVAYRLRARWRGDRPVAVRGVQWLTVRDGRIRSRVDYWDAASFLAQSDPAAAAVLARFGVGSTPPGRG